MSLSIEQKRATREEFSENFTRVGITPAEAAHDLEVTPRRIEDIANLRHIRHLEDAWILRRYLQQRAEEEGITLAPFTALRGNPDDYWFLDAERVKRMQLD